MTTKFKVSPKKHPIFSAVVAALPASVLSALVLPALATLGWSSVAEAQYRLGNDGHALDANNRVGSGGYNEGGFNHNAGSSINGNIVTGNVSGLGYFHGNNAGEFDPNVFQGNTGTANLDRFDAISAPVNTAQRTTGASAYNPYYNTNTLVGQGPPGFVQTPSGQGVMPAPTVSALTPTKFDDRIDLPDTDPTKGNLLPQGQTDIGGPVDPSTGDQTMYSMSPLYGVRQNDTNLQQDAIFNSRAGSMNAGNRATMTPGQIQQMRDELNRTVVPSGQTGQPNLNAQPSQTGQPGQIDNTQAPAPGTLSGGQPLSNASLSPMNLATQAPLGSAVVTSSQVGADLNSGQSLQNSLITPAKQSKQLADLEKKYAADKGKLTDVQAAQLFNEERKLQNAADKANAGTTARPKPAMTATDMAHDTGTMAMKPDDKSPAPTPKPVLNTPDNSSTKVQQPYVVTSLATGIEAKGLGQLMKTAEDKMRQGKFTEAVDTYDTAEQVAPNNPFVALGRSIAELGASYYGKADLDLNAAIILDPAVLAGRYDLQGFLGEDRAKFVHDDLQDIADHEKGARALVLLGFIAHNNGDDALAQKDLNEAARRGGYVVEVKQMKEAWGLK